MASPPKAPASAKRSAKPAQGAASKGKGKGAAKKTTKVVRHHHDDGPHKLVARPPHRRLFVYTGPAWLVLEPHRLGLAAASLCTLLAAFYYSLRSWAGTAYAPSQMLVGALATFVVSYAAVGIFVWYVLSVTDREFGPQVEPEKKKRSLLQGAHKPAATEHSAAPTEAMPAAEAQPEE